jgi:glycosyltransferase involved in cell wall biosynthesis
LMNDIVGSKCDYIYYPNDFNEAKISKGQFLDIERTIEFKAKQLAMVSKAFQAGLIHDGDCFIVGDLFFPGIESIKYMAELQNITVKIVGFNYAGRADLTDFVRGLGDWSDWSEMSYHHVADKVFVGSDYHRAQVVDYFDLPESKVVTTGYVWDAKKAYDIYPHLHTKEEFVIYPHRLCKEKGYAEFVNVCNLYPEYQFIVTSSGNKNTEVELPQNAEYIYSLTKQEYYKYLSKAKYYLSTAYQETFGYTIQEALMYDCVIAAPMRACYAEVVEDFALYQHIEDIGAIFKAGKTHEHSSFKTKYASNIDYIMEFV